MKGQILYASSEIHRNRKCFWVIPMDWGEGEGRENCLKDTVSVQEDEEVLGMNSGNGYTTT